MALVLDDRDSRPREPSTRSKLRQSLLRRDTGKDASKNPWLFYYGQDLLKRYRRARSLGKAGGQRSLSARSPAKTLQLVQLDPKPVASSNSVLRGFPVVSMSSKRRSLTKKRAAAALDYVKACAQLASAPTGTSLLQASKQKKQRRKAPTAGVGAVGGRSGSNATSSSRGDVGLGPPSSMAPLQAVLVGANGREGSPAAMPSLERIDEEPPLSPACCAEKVGASAAPQTLGPSFDCGSKLSVCERSEGREQEGGHAVSHAISPALASGHIEASKEARSLVGPVNPLDLNEGRASPPTRGQPEHSRPVGAVGEDTASTAEDGLSQDLPDPGCTCAFDDDLAEPGGLFKQAFVFTEQSQRLRSELLQLQGFWPGAAVREPQGVDAPSGPVTRRRSMDNKVSCPADLAKVAEQQGNDPAPRFGPPLARMEESTSAERPARTPKKIQAAAAAEHAHPTSELESDALAGEMRVGPSLPKQWTSQVSLDCAEPFGPPVTLAPLHAEARATVQAAAERIDPSTATQAEGPASAKHLGPGKPVGGPSMQRERQLPQVGGRSWVVWDEMIASDKVPSGETTSDAPIANAPKLLAENVVKGSNQDGTCKGKDAKHMGCAHAARPGLGQLKGPQQRLGKRPKEQELLRLPQRRGQHPKKPDQLQRDKENVEEVRMAKCPRGQHRAAASAKSPGAGRPDAQPANLASLWMLREKYLSSRPSRP